MHQTSSLPLEMALSELPMDALMNQVPQLLNSIEHLLGSNKWMKEYDPNKADPELSQAQQENELVIDRQFERIDLTLKVIRKNVGEPAAREMESVVQEFKQKYNYTSTDNPEPEPETLDENGMFL